MGKVILLTEALEKPNRQAIHNIHDTHGHYILTQLCV
jgi:hypothetical protein